MRSSNVSGKTPLQRLSCPNASGQDERSDSGPARPFRSRRRPLRPLPAIASLVLVALVALSASGCRKEPRKPFSIATARPDTRRTLSSGDVVGGDGRYGSDAWLGIPFAAPPVGELRWRAPRPPAAWEGVRPALASGPPCLQQASRLTPGYENVAPGTPVGTEDCLYLNVWAPRAAEQTTPAGAQDGRPWPVMVWLHGGGNSIGTAAMYEGGRLASSEKVVVIAVQYRLGPLGWFRHRALRQGESDALEASGNYGTLDLIRALHWVKENAAAFGGDPDNVTVFGESAGAMNVFSLLLSPSAKGLFHRAIAQSGGLRHFAPAEAEALAEGSEPGHRGSSGEVLLRLLVHQGKAKDRAGAKAALAAMGDAELATWLRTVDGRALFEALADLRRMGMLDLPMVFSDGALLPSGDWLERLGREDGWNRVPVLLGTNLDEAKLFLSLDERHVTRWFGLFPRFVDEPSYQATAGYLSRAWKLTGADLPAAAMRRSGARDVYVYRFDWRGEGDVPGMKLSELLGAAHGLDIPFVFGHFDFGEASKYLFPPERAPANERLSAAMRSYWVQHARTGSPGKGLRGELPAWTAWDDASPSSPRYLRLDLEEAGGLRMGAEVESAEQLAQAWQGDGRLHGVKERCRVAHDWTAFLGLFPRKDYGRLGGGVCAGLPAETYPWDEP